MLTAPVIDHAVAPVRFDRVLFPTDFSPCSRQALTCVSQIATSYRSHVFILHVVSEESPCASETVSDFAPHLFEIDGHEAEKHIRHLENSGVLSQFDHSILLERGPLQDVIENTIRRRAVDLVVMGTHGREGIEKVLLGSVAEGISRQSACAVLIAGPQVSLTSPGSAIRHVLCATAFSGKARDPLHYAASIARHYSADLTLLHVCRFLDGGPMVNDEAVIAAEAKKLNASLLEEVQLPKTTKALAQIGFVADTILKVAADSRADLIVMGVHSTHYLRAATHMPWNITHRVISHATCPVVTVRG